MIEFTLSRVSMIACGVILLAAVVLGRGLAALAGAAALCALYLLIHLLSPKSMGGGDVKLALGLGALTGMCGADVWVLAAIGAPLLTAVCAVVVLLRRHDRTVPHGPSMCAATALAVMVSWSCLPLR